MSVLSVGQAPSTLSSFGGGTVLSARASVQRSILAVYLTSSSAINTVSSIERITVNRLTNLVVSFDLGCIITLTPLYGDFSGVGRQTRRRRCQTFLPTGPNGQRTSYQAPWDSSVRLSVSKNI